ncbi:MAG: Kazal-type serine protease inhibitor, partial [Candidatus Bathyarchaeota archaeon]|nr:Kazal-type serine protease inhibitor [Candidatus Bathyarchaeota archaeon]
DQVLTARLRDEGKDPAPILAKVDELTHAIITTGDKMIGDESIGTSSQTFSSLMTDISTRTFALAGLASVVVNTQNTGNQDGVTNTQTCATIWSCNDWSECVNGIQTRTCNSANNCKNNVNVIPSTSRKCTATISGTSGTTSTSSVSSQEVKTVLPDMKPNETICAQDYTPVCGADNQTYSNRCVAESKGVTIAYGGECKKIEIKPPVANDSVVVNPPSQEPSNVTQTTSSSNWTVIVNPISTDTGSGTTSVNSTKNWNVVVVKR